MATGATGHHTSHLFYITDRTSKLCLLVETGAEVSLLPLTPTMHAPTTTHTHALILQAPMERH